MKKAFLISALAVALASCGGNYVITQQLSHNIFSGDAFIELSAKDKNSPVSGIRVYYVSAEIDFERDIVEHDKLNSLSKSALKAINLDIKPYGAINTASVDSTACFLSFKNEVSDIVFRTYRAPNGCLALVVRYHGNSYVAEDVKCWLYQNGKLKEIEPPFPDDFYEYVQFTIQDQGTESFDADGIFFSLAEDEQLFVFDGKYFVKGYRHYDYDDAEE